VTFFRLAPGPKWTMAGFEPPVRWRWHLQFLSFFCRFTLQRAW